MKKLPDKFIQRMKAQLGAEAEDFFEALSLPSPTSIRLNHFKGRSSFPDTERIPWCEQGLYLESRPRFQLDPHWHGGAYYVQEASSMILDFVIDALALDHTPRIWLDMCAAPGGKTGILAKHILPSDILIANEVISQRKTILWENLVKGGYVNTMLTSEKPSSFTEPFADIILIDAPCAGEGMMRKEPEAIHQWSPGLVDSCALVQKEIFRHTVNALAPEGYLIYSTCSYSLEENIYNIAYFKDVYELECLTLPFPDAWGIIKMEYKGATGYQMYPHKLKGEGLFIAVLKNQSKNQNSAPGFKKQLNEFIPVPSSMAESLNDPLLWKIIKNSENHSLISAASEENANAVLQRFPRAEIIGGLGKIKGKDFIPSHFMAMSGIQHPAFRRIDLKLDEALNYLERSTSISSSENQTGWYLPAYQNTSLGWLKLTSQGWKNQYPLNWRLRSR